MEYTYSFRIYPSDVQKIQLAKTFGCCRFAYNYFLDDFNKNGYTSKFAKNNKCNQELKTEYPWLKEVDKFAITNSIYNLDNACKRYMGNLGGKPANKCEKWYAILSN